jgi:hypothetical protein
MPFLAALRILRFSCISTRIIDACVRISDSHDLALMPASLDFL